MKWFTAAFFANGFGILSFNAFIGTDFSHSQNLKSVSIIIMLYDWMLLTIGPIPSGVLFALCLVGVVALALRSRKAEVK